MSNKLGKMTNPFVNKYKRYPLVEKVAGAQLYAYSATATITLENIDEDNPQDLSQYIIGFSIEKNFEKLFCPLVKIILSIPLNLASSIQDNFRNSSLFFTLERHTIQDKVTIASSPDPVYKGVEMSIVYIDGPAFVDDGQDLGDIDSMPIKNSNASIPLTLYLYEKKALEVKKPLLNKVYTDVTISDVLNLLVTENFKDRKVIIDKPENEDTYEQIFIPPLSFPDIVEYLQAFYGIYKSGVEVFMDLDAVYLISKDSNAKCGDLYKDINLRVRSSVQTDELSKAKGSRSTFIDEESKSVNLTLDSFPEIESGDVLSKEFIGESLYLNNDKKLDITVGGGGINPSDEDAKTKERVLWTKTSSKFASDEATLRINRCTEIARFVVDNTDINYFNPVSVFHLGYAFMINDDVEANYRLSLTSTGFKRGEDATLSKSYHNIFYAKTYARVIRK